MKANVGYFYSDRAALMPFILFVIFERLKDFGMRIVTNLAVTVG